MIARFVLFLGFPTYSLSVVLAALLAFTGLGAALSGRFGSSRRALTTSLVLVVALIVAAAFGLPSLLSALIDLPFAARIAVAALVLAPYGVTMGMAMPIGLLRLSGLYRRGVPWAWGINGVTSVLASVLALAVAITLGFTAATLVAAACYALAAAHALLGRWPNGPERVGAVDETDALAKAPVT
jgi:MFS family permease